MPLQVFTLRERPELRPAVFSADFQPPFWPEYLLHDVAARLSGLTAAKWWHVHSAYRLPFLCWIAPSCLMGAGTQ